jgi:hypothetical protein
MNNVDRDLIDFRTLAEFIRKRAGVEGRGGRVARA